MDAPGFLRYNNHTIAKSDDATAGRVCGRPKTAWVKFYLDEAGMRNMTGRMLFVCLSLIFMLVPAVPALSARCDDHGVLHDVEHYIESWGWGTRNERLMINLWDSPDHVAVVGMVNPGSYVVILEEREGYYKVRSTEGATGWIMKDQLAAKLPREEAPGYKCAG